VAHQAQGRIGQAGLRIFESIFRKLRLSRHDRMELWATRHLTRHQPRFLPPMTTRENEDMTNLRTLLIPVALTVSATSVGAHDYTRGGLFIDHPWTRPTPQGVKVGAGYFVIRNRGKSPDRLVSASSPIAGKVEIHQTSVKDGVATMREVQGGLKIAPGKSVEFKPRSFHLMLLDLKQALKQGDKFPATLVFDKAGAIDVEFQVDATSTAAPAKHKH
jgi:copper(I)-binding protein